MTLLRSGVIMSAREVFITVVMYQTPLLEMAAAAS